MKARILVGSAAIYALPLLALAHTGEHGEVAASTSLALPIVILGGVAVGVAIGAFIYARTKHLRIPLAVGIATAVLASGALTYVHVPQKPPATAANEYPQLAGVSMEVYKSPGCSCCSEFIAELQAQSVEVTVREVSDEELAHVKERYGIRPELESCHTTMVNGYVVEGHVPFEAIVKLLSEKPSIAGIALPGMPIGSPGMSGPKTEPFKVQTLTGEPYLTL